VTVRSASFEEFYFEARHNCLRAVAAHVGTVSAAEELVAEAFTRALRNWDRVNTHPSPSAWVVTTALNVQRDRWRKVQRATRLANPRETVETFGARSEQLLTERTIEPRIVRAISNLPERQREVLVYRVILDLSTATTAQLLNIDPGTVTTHLRRSLSALRNALPAETAKGMNHD
jgi:RNA polymerase sigma factor (sigma-70 family)